MTLSDTERLRRSAMTLPHTLLLILAVACVAAFGQVGFGAAEAILGQTKGGSQNALGQDSFAGPPALTTRSEAGLLAGSSKLSRTAATRMVRTVKAGVHALDHWRTPADFDALQRRLPGIMNSDHDIVLNPSLSLEGVDDVKGLANYEERSLWKLVHLRNPHARVHLVSSAPFPEETIRLMAKQLDIDDDGLSRLYTYSPPGRGTTRWLSTTMLQYPQMLQQIRRNIRAHRTYMSPFATSPSERALAENLRIPLRAADPDLQYRLESKSMARRLLRRSGIQIPDGAEDVRTVEDVVDAIDSLLMDNPALTGVVVKMNHASSGQGNAVLDLSRMQSQLTKATEHERRTAIRSAVLNELEPANKNLSGPQFFAQLKKGGVVEAFIDGAEDSPSVQMEIFPDRSFVVHSTHDQLLDGQVYKGCRYPARCDYQSDLLTIGRQAAKTLAEEGYVGRAAIDTMPRIEDGQWQHFAVDLNLREGGTTHGFEIAKHTSRADVDPQTGTLRTARGTEIFYNATDNLQHDIYKNLTVADLYGLSDRLSQPLPEGGKIGAFYHMVGGIEEFGKVGITVTGRSSKEVAMFYAQAVELMEQLAKSK